MPVVLDTNVLASIATTPKGSKLDFIAKSWQSDLFSVHISSSILTELERTLKTTPYFNSKLTDEQINTYVDLVRTSSVFQEVTTTIDHEEIRKRSSGEINPEDDYIIATAIDAKAKFLVTGDKPLVRLWSYSGVLIINPADFVEILKHEEALIMGKT
jgi:uncharacterized protein